MLWCGKLLCVGPGKALAVRGALDHGGCLVVVYATVVYDWCETFHAGSWRDML